MRVSRLLLTAVALVLAASPTSARGQKPVAEAKHVIHTPADIKWGPAPPVLPAGAQIAVLDGDPGKEGLFTFRLKFPDGYRIAPHTHPTDEHVVVMSGTLSIGMGATRADAMMHQMPAGSFTSLPKNSPHYVTARGETVLQIYGQGPFVLTYVNPADKPTR